MVAGQVVEGNPVSSGERQRLSRAGSAASKFISHIHNHTISGGVYVVDDLPGSLIIMSSFCFHLRNWDVSVARVSLWHQNLNPSATCALGVS